MIACIVQARMGSTRLPGKVLAEIGDHTMLAQVLNRSRQIRAINALILATTTLPDDDVLEAEATYYGAKFFRGPDADVLDRYYYCAKEIGATTIMRITADCPLIDPLLCEQVLARFSRGDVDYASNVFPATYPDGLDCEVFGFETLERAWKHAVAESHREHVTPYIWARPEEFRCGVVAHRTYLRHIRWTVDTAEDLEHVRAIYGRFGGQRVFDWSRVLETV